MEKAISIPYFEEWWDNNKSLFISLPAGYAYYIEAYHLKPLEGLKDGNGRIKDPYTFAKNILDKHLRN